MALTLSGEAGAAIESTRDRDLGSLRSPPVTADPLRRPSAPDLFARTL